jgi:uncharacterized protein Smg (DUF494 family)
MKIEIKNYGNTYSVETKNDDLEISEVIEIITGLLLQVGFHKENINNAINKLADGSN